MPSKFSDDVARIVEAARWRAQRAGEILGRLQQTAGVRAQRSTSYATRDGVCMFFLSGYCRSGAACPLRHSEPEPGTRRRATDVEDDDEAPPAQRARITPQTPTPRSPDKIVAASTRRVTAAADARKLRATECSICLENLSKPKLDPIVQVIGCKHPFHRRCLVEWAARGDTCPMCATTFRACSGS